MRAKRPYIVLSFGSTVAAMAWEKHCTEKTIPGRLIPLPRELSAGCGLAWRMLPEEWAQWEPKLDRTAFDAVAEVMQ